MWTNGCLALGTAPDDWPGGEILGGAGGLQRVWPGQMGVTSTDGHFARMFPRAPATGLSLGFALAVDTLPTERGPVAEP